MASVNRRIFVKNISKAIAAGGVSFAVNRSAALAFNRNGETDLERLQNKMKNSRPLKWVFTGDSITQGAKHTKGVRSYTEVAAERLRFEMGRPRDIIINTAISGNNSGNILSDYSWRVAQFMPDVVSLMIGTNDAAENTNISGSRFKQNLLSLVENIRKCAAIPILHAPNEILFTKPGGDIRTRLPEYVRIIRAVALEQRLIFIDNWQLWKETPNAINDWLNDPLHPNGKGHLEIARNFFRVLGILDPHSFTCSGTIQCN